MTLRKVIRDQEGIPPSQGGLPSTKVAWNSQKTSKITQKVSRSASSGMETDRCQIGNQTRYIFSIMTISKVIRAQEGGSISQSGSPTTKVSWIFQKTPKVVLSGLNWPKNFQNHPKNVTFCWLCQRTRQVLHRQPITQFHEMSLSKVIRAQKGIPTSQSSLPSTKVA